MIGDFKACGGFLMIATGFRIMKLRQFPTADMIQPMILDYAYFLGLGQLGGSFVS